MLGAVFVVVALIGALIGMRSEEGSVPPGQANLVHEILAAQDEPATASGSVGAAAVAADQFGTPAQTLTPAAAGEAAQPALPSVSGQPALRPHEVFGFAPYWTLGQSAEFDLAGLTTVDYFAIGINPDGSPSESGAGWDGFESQQFLDLVDRAHAAGDRVVVTVNDFDQGSLDALASSAPAAARLAQAVLGLVQSKNLDGVNLDLEGEGSGDQTGLTDLVSKVSSVLKSANPRYQLTVDTYASSAGDPSGFYNIPALNRVVDGFFVMAYQLNLKGSPADGSQLTSTMFSNQSAAQQYAAAVPADKVILGLAFFGYDWPTSNGTLDATAQGAPSIVTYDQEAASGHQIYWDSVTDTAWTSYLVGQQWHEAFFENPNALYMAAQLSQQDGLGGVGIWALGMDGSNDQSMVSALDGLAPAAKDTLAGPSSTGQSAEPSVGSTGTATGDGSAPTAGPPAPSASGPVARPPAPPRTTTTTSRPAPRVYSYSGTWQGAAVTLTKSSAGSGTRTEVGTLVGFASSDPSLSCLRAEASLGVFSFSSDTSHLYVLARPPGDCAEATFTFAGSAPTTTTTSLAASGITTTTG
jgi:hypothetical protein